MKFDNKFDGLETGIVQAYPKRTYFTYQSCIVCPGCGNVLMFDVDERDKLVVELLRYMSWKKSSLTNKWYCNECCQQE